MTVAFESVDSGLNGSGAATQSLSITQPAANELIFVVYGCDGNASLTGIACEDQNGDPFTQIQSHLADANVTGATFYKIADGDETTLTITFTGLNHKGQWGVAVYSGTATSGVLEDSAEDTTYVSSTTTSSPTGTATATAAGVAVYAQASDDGRKWADDGTPPTLSSGTARAYSVSNATGGMLLADDIYASGGSKTTTWSGANAATYAWGTVALFKAPGTGVTPSPFGHQKLDNQYSAIAASRLNGVLQ